MGLLVIVLIPVMQWLGRGKTIAAESGKAPALPVRSLVGLLLCISFFNIGSGAIWGFSERVGLQAGFSVEESGFIIATGAVSGVMGALFAGWLGDRWGRRRPVILALVLAGLGYMILGGATNSASYISGVNLYWVIYMFLLPLMIGHRCSHGCRRPRRHTGRRRHLADLCVRTGLRRIYCDLVLLCCDWLVFLCLVPAGRAGVYSGQTGGYHASAYRVRGTYFKSVPISPISPISPRPDPISPYGEVPRHSCAPVRHSLQLFHCSYTVRLTILTSERTSVLVTFENSLGGKTP